MQESRPVQPGRIFPNEIGRSYKEYRCSVERRLEQTDYNAALRCWTVMDQSHILRSKLIVINKDGAEYGRYSDILVLWLREQAQDCPPGPNLT
jgi:hypothetical protein